MRRQCQFRWCLLGLGGLSAVSACHVGCVVAPASMPFVSSPSSCCRGNRRPSHRRSLLRLRAKPDADDAGSSGAIDFGTAQRGDRKAKDRRRGFVVSEPIDAYAEYQLSRIFAGGDRSRRFAPLSLAGRSQTTSAGSRAGISGLETILLSPPQQCQMIAESYERHLGGSGEGGTQSRSRHPALPLPLAPSMSSNARVLLSRAYANRPLSKSVLLSLNTLLVNRDGGLFDNLPWSTWSIDPDSRERDAANNVVEEKFTMGKRTAYQRFMGKDWQGRSLSLGNLANRIRYLLEGQQAGDTEDDTAETGDDMMLSLSRRLLQLEAKEARMDIAECEQNLAIAKTRRADAEVGDGGDEGAATARLREARDRLHAAETLLEELATAAESATWGKAPLSFGFPRGTDGKNVRSLLIAVLDKLAEQENPPPYRGAIGYAAKLDSREEMFYDSVLPYTNPYELLIEIIGEQLNLQVMGCVLEQTSCLEGNLVLGGALLLKRKGVRKSATLAGEVVSYTDDEDALGNEGVLPGSMYLVECFSDEALGMAMASGQALFVEEEVYNRAGKAVELDVHAANRIKAENGGEQNCVTDVESLSFSDRVPPIRPVDEPYFSSGIEGDRISLEKDSNRVLIPLNTNPRLFDGPGQSPQAPQTQSSAFSTFNPVNTLAEYDGLTDDAKTRLLLKLESFTGTLPRPRAMRTAAAAEEKNYDSGTPPSLLDDLLLPLVDEAVRRQYLIRDAERRKDVRASRALREKASARQVALERAQEAREEGLDADAERMEEEARLYRALRADTTQDEGAYNRFLDKDEWYERETRARIKRLDKSKFGTLLDGVDLP